LSILNDLEGARPKIAIIIEAVGIAASFTGILAFAGQAIEGIIQLRAFFKDVSLAPRRTGELLNNLESLTSTLSDIQGLIERLGEKSNDKLNTGAIFNTTILRGHLKACADDIASWVKVTRNADPRTENGLRAFFRKVKIAVDKSGFEELGTKISSHQQRIGISLSILGRCVLNICVEQKFYWPNANR
jgi:hypothetical protein